MLGRLPDELVHAMSEEIAVQVHKCNGQALSVRESYVIRCKGKERLHARTLSSCTSCVLSHSGDSVRHKNWTQDLTATGLDHHDLPIQLKQMDVSKHGFKIMGMICSMIRGYDSGA